MPNTASAKKALRQSEKKFIRNEKIRASIAYFSRMARKSLDNKKTEPAKDFVTKAVKQIDKALQKGIIKKNTASRKKSILMKSLTSKTATPTKKRKTKVKTS